MFEFNTTRTAAQTRDMTDRSWTCEAVGADGAVVADYTLAPVRVPEVGERWLAVRGTDLADYEALVGSYGTLEDAHEGAEAHARGLWHGALAARSGHSLPDPDMLAAMAPEFGSAYREAFEAWHADDAAAAERRAGE